ncbi:MAG: DUF4124 domain-containing protein [Gammaproteobacteria bacterium]|nr:DUF4124 domain-containing protein [Gammaproteobacteria bacterium]MBU1555933.1 DUF4124 domain-containing protein [Gammaproteobacteria bacterium]MBU2070817.1 DUF4124 domain-containing protein [Gammaproteobacteria bacterium]MBU2182808.1 DUF4124 domain-containing protein [Gammaproteobacteria bacterium]MBU2205950.1 DUF4124 domain-containing protein [Gammaproteobacteria bacterium]
MKTLVLASILCSLMWHLPAMAQVYKWVDEKGNVHYSDRPQTLDSEPVNIDTGQPVEAAGTTTADTADSTATNGQVAVDANANANANAQADAVADTTEPAEPVFEPISVPAPMANCSAAAENARRILLSQNSKPEFRQLAASANFKAGFVQSCRQNSTTEAGRAEAVCIQRAKNFADFEACSG